MIDMGADNDTQVELAMAGTVQRLDLVILSTRGSCSILL